MDEEEKNVLMFISFTRDEMASVLRQPYSDENGAMMLDFSESLLEGAELIARKHTYKKDSEEGMLDVVEHMGFLLERITKYYISHKAGLTRRRLIRKQTRMTATMIFIPRSSTL